jgi:hypothetical protein
MNFIDYLYFNIYKWYFKMKISGRDVDPQNMAAIMFGLSIGGWYFAITLIYNRFVKHIYFLKNTDTIIFIILAIITGGIINLIYSSNNRYLTVYDKFISSDIGKKRKRGLIISFGIVLMPLLIIMIYFLILMII